MTKNTAGKKSKFIVKCIYAIAVIILFIIVFYVFKYFSDSDEISLPLKEGIIYNYEGNYITQNSNKSIKMRAPNHKIVIERAFDTHNENRFLIALWIGEYRTEAFIITQNQEGIFSVMGSDYKTLIIPRFIKRSKPWTFNFGSTIIKAKMENKETIAMPSGTYSARKISFKSSTGMHIDLWINNNEGIVAFRYSNISAGAGRDEADMKLTNKAKG